MFLKYRKIHEICQLASNDDNAVIDLFEANKKSNLDLKEAKYVDFLISYVGKSIETYGKQKFENIESEKIIEHIGTMLQACMLIRK